MYSKQKGYCRICGIEMLWTPNTPWIKNVVCGKECNREFHWRETLSILGKEYYPDPEPNPMTDRDVEWVVGRYGEEIRILVNNEMQSSGDEFEFCLERVLKQKCGGQTPTQPLPFNSD